MFFTECERLAKRHPDLAVVIEQIDAQLQEMGTAEVLRVDDFTSFLGVDLNKVTSVFEMLAEEGLLVSEEMVECPRCDMAVLCSEYEEALEEYGEFRCTSCDLPLPQDSAKVITTYRRGEKWEERQPAEAGEKNDSSSVPLESYSKDTYIFRKQGTGWLVVYAGIPKIIRHSTGMDYIAYLLGCPNHEIHSFKLRLTVQSDKNYIAGSSDELLDDRALKEYKERVAYLDEEIAVAEANNDISKKDALHEERERLYTEIARAMGLGGKKRKVSSDRKRARQAISAAIHRALQAIKKEHEPLWKHLHNALKIGEVLSYQPDQSLFWTL